MKLVVKIGGQAQEDAAVRKGVARQIAALARAGNRVVVVHGGGKLLTQTLEQLGIRSEFHHGLRVTDARTRDVALMVLAGIVNKQWVAELETQGQSALGLCGGDGNLAQARKLALRANGLTKDLGFVGRPSKINPQVLEMALGRGLVPVVASLAPNARGEYFNINADDFAAALASAVAADRLLYLTESGGVRNAEAKLVPIVKLNDIGGLIRTGVVRDGMIPKLRSCARILGRQVREIDILSPAVPEGLLRAAESRELVGTRIVKR
ncbi:MAG: acetylglutamate kinase [Acidobacteria bacterium]|nr:MAG: acetylglutamate kinase [Acidobacteriota bacterium]